ncbi:uncharacterized protein LOC143371637 [Andrena cerasifolii]|uniref:uncharacterized protein LOC143371637 n=1 Tax=Andrena cerasifolii TaxID=2819439 RepID=UPI004037FE4F
MDRKQHRGSSTRADRTKKRKFTGNIHTREREISLASTSAKKLASTNLEDFTVNPSHGYRIIAFLSVFTAISQFVVCKVCKGQVNFCETNSRGLGFKITIECKCGSQYINSCPLIDGKSYEINRRIILVLRMLGVGKEGLNTFCGLMDICQGISSTLYYTSLDSIYSGAKTVFDILRRKAVEEEKIKNAENGNPMTEITVSGDGTWKKRGFNSLFGVTSLIGKYSSKIIDIVVKSSYCHGCKVWESKSGTVEYDLWMEEHKDECTANHSGSSGKMEVDGMKEMFLRSVEYFGIRYRNYIGDGDTKTFKALLEENPYGDDFILKKKECVGHVEKRMGSRLRNIKKTKKLGGKNKLTDKLIKQLTVYYGLAIRRHSGSIDDMYEAIWATYYHKISSDKYPKHMYCPKGSGSWCKWRKAEAEGTLKQFNHEPPLHEDVAKEIKSIYEDLSSKELLERCLGGETQNNNESFNSSLWRLAPKHLHCGLKTIEISAFIAAGIFNEGCYAILNIMDNIGIVIGDQCKSFATTRDEWRLQRSARRSLEATKKARTEARMANLEKNQFDEQEEGIIYGPGIAD